MNHLAFDIGGNFIKFGIISKENDIISRGKFVTPLDNMENFLKCIKKIYDKYKDVISGIAISMPGKIDNYNGRSYTAGALTYLEGANIVDLFHTFTDMPVAVENDGKCAALAESWFGTLKDVNSGIVLVFGTGVGGGIIINNRLHRGYNNVGGEFSFMLNSNDLENSQSFGQYGNVRALIDGVEKKKGLKAGSLTGEEAFSRINHNNEGAYQALVEYCDLITLYLYNLQHILDPEKIAIGGGISEQEIFINCLKDRIRLFKEERPYLLATPDIVQSEFKNDANLLGALVNFRINYVKKRDKKLKSN